MNLQEQLNRIQGMMGILSENSNKLNPIQLYIDENGFNNAIKEFGSVEFIAKKLNVSTKELLEKYKPFDDIFTESEFKEELEDTILWIKDRESIINRHDNLDKVIEFIISMTIDAFHSQLINWDDEPHDWKIPQTPNLLKLIYGDWIKENDLFRKTFGDKFN